MHIIFGKDQAEKVSDKYIVLELDTFQFGTKLDPITAYCAVETVPLGELTNLLENQTLHEYLMINYRGRAWQDCLLGIEKLTGKWRGELDTFYADLRSRVETHINNPPPANWSPIILKPAS